MKDQDARAVAALLHELSKNVERIKKGRQKISDPLVTDSNSRWQGG